MNRIKRIDFKRYTSIKIGPQLDVLEIDEIKEYPEYQILGRGNNILISPETKIKFAILGKEFDYIKEENNLLFVGCATSSGKLLTYTRKNNIANLEFLAKLPGNLGGLTKMNAGLKSWEIFNYINRIKTRQGYIEKQDILYSYRETKIDDIIYEVIFDIEKGFDKQKVKEFNKMRDNQPKIPSAGSCFRNPKNDFAGRLIQEVGLKGVKKGDMGFSKEHANFLVNYGEGTFEDAIYLITLAKKRIKEEFGIHMEEEIIVYK